MHGQMICELMLLYLIEQILELLVLLQNVCILSLQILDVFLFSLTRALGRLLVAYFSPNFSQYSLLCLAQWARLASHRKVSVALLDEKSLLFFGQNVVGYMPTSSHLLGLRL